ncbi:MAG TPA: citrate synthase family protein [Gammaproteobacteria bacterium]|nr:citrate synthase family protein [Gammaproteobacteria bacterium]
MPSEPALYLSAPEAAAELGVSAATLYAYVSRGLVRSEPVPGERAKRYRAEDVRALRERRAPPSSDGAASARRASSPTFNGPVLASGISVISDGALYYRGVDAAELARHATLETAASLLWQTTDYDPFAAANLPRIAGALRAVIDSTKECHPVDRAMAALALAGQADDGAFNRTDHGLAMTAARIVRLLAALLGGREASAAPVHEQLAAAWSLDAKGKELVRMALVLLADHELNASTFTLRCAVSTGANLYEGIVAALAALKGPLHGGATTRAALQLEKLLEGDPLGLVREQAEAAERFAGFGHAIYRDFDPRAKALLDAIAKGFGERFLTRELPEYVHKVAGVRPNVDYALAALVRVLGLPRLAAIGLFAVGRSVGWAAHAREQMRERMLIRPRAIYTGPAPRSGRDRHEERGA